MSEQLRARHFCCTQCGQCCNRAPEMELSEAASLADIFVLRLMFRLYWLPNQPGDLDPPREQDENMRAVFYEKKRLLSGFAARKYPVKLRRNGKAVAYTKYLMVSALALQTRQGSCSALHGTSCAIYERRPLSCRSVPLHYSRAERLAENDLERFVATPGYRCDTSDQSPIILQEGRIVDRQILSARSEALLTAERDRSWSEAIVHRLNGSDPSLPTLQEIEANAPVGAMTTSMRVAWSVAVDRGLLEARQLKELISAQLGLIREEIAMRKSSSEAQTLVEMRDEYHFHLERLASLNI